MNPRAEGLVSVRPPKAPRLGPGAWFAVVLLTGGLLVTLANREATFSPARGDVASRQLTDAEKLAVESKVNTSDMLFNLAFGTLAALVGLRFHERVGRRLTGVVPVVASGLLGLSLYSSFLLRSTLENAILLGPATMLYGSAPVVPLAAQFWCFVFAVLLLAGWVLSARTIVVLVFALTPWSAAATASGEDVSPAKCAGQWAAERGADLSGSATDAAVRVIRRVVERSGVRVPAGEECTYMRTQLDALRSVALAGDVPQAEWPAWADTTLAELDRQTSTPGFSFGELLSKLLAASAPWGLPASGLLRVVSEPSPVQVMVSPLTSAGRPATCFTVCEIRLSPGPYRLVFLRDAARFAPDRDVTITDGATRELKLP
jgi:hypothetical protein